MRKTHFFISFLISLFLFSSCGNNSPSPASVKKNVPGKNNYETYCIACHGADGTAGTLGAKDLSISTMDRTQMAEIISKGKGTMTPFSNVMSPEKIDTLVTYLYTLRK